MCWHRFEQKRSPAKPERRSRMCTNPTGFLILVEREGNTKSLLQKMCWMMINHTKKTPISNIKGSLFCTRMSGNPGRIKRTDIIQEKCLFYRYTDGHGARKTKGEDRWTMVQRRIGPSRGPASAERCPPSRADGTLLTEPLGNGDSKNR